MDKKHRPASTSRCFASICASGLMLIAVSNNAGAVMKGSADEQASPVVALGAGFAVCTGTLVAPRAVLTAAHCVATMPLTHVSFGQRWSNDELRRIADVIVHPAFNKQTMLNDIAIVLLESDAPVQPARMLHKKPRPGMRIDVVGFGTSELRETGNARSRRRGKMIVANVSEQVFIAKAAPACACSRDSGGPAFLGGAVLGIVIAGDLWCKRLTQLVRLDAYSDFVQGALKRPLPAP